MEPTDQGPKTIPSPGEAFLILIVTFLLTIAFVPVLRMVGFAPESKWSLFFTELFMIFPAVAFLMRRRYEVSLVMRLQPVSLRVLTVSLVLGVALSIWADEIERLMHLLLPLPPELESLFSNEMLQQLLTGNSLIEWILLFLTLVVLAGLFEEMLFRGMLQNALEERMDITRAVISTAVVFSMIHFNPYWVVPIAILGVFLGVLAWKSNSIYPSAVVHAVNNAMALWINNWDEKNAGMLLWHGHVNPLLLIAAGAAVFFGVRLFYRYIEEETEIPTILNQPL